MSKLLIPNTTQVPNVLLDVMMRQLSDPALRVLLAIVRKTYGFQKEADHISLTQLQQITALSRQGVVNGIKALGPLIVIRQGKREGNEYALNLNVETGELVNGVDQSTRLTSQRSTQTTSQRGRHTKPNKNKTK
jgi:phage replication O-like protein O